MSRTAAPHPTGGKRRRTAIQNAADLRQEIGGADRSLVFFVGAGASAAGLTNMPTTPAILKRLLLEAFSQSSTATMPHSDALVGRLKALDPNVGFEITLNDLNEVCPGAVTAFFNVFAEYELQCVPNAVHQMLADWISSGGSVITTNYDRLIERALEERAEDAHVYFTEATGDSHSLDEWRDGLQRGGALFKLHGSLDQPSSCLGTLEHVTTILSGHRARLMAEVMYTRPVCFVGWRGVDPDIPPLLRLLYEKRPPALPTYWIHYEGSSPGVLTLSDVLAEVPLAVSAIASERPIITEANRFFGGHSSAVTMVHTRLDFSTIFGGCTASSVARFVGISLRRQHHHDESVALLERSVALARSEAERAAARVELSHSLWVRSDGRHPWRPLYYLWVASRQAKKWESRSLRLSVHFGLASMLVLAARWWRPWFAALAIWRLRAYRRAIEAYSGIAEDAREPELHRAMCYLYTGRLRFERLLGWLAWVAPRTRAWLLEPYSAARATIDNAGDLHIHSTLDVLAYHAVAAASCGECEAAIQDLLRIDRLALILADTKRTAHWRNEQRRSIVAACGEPGE